MAERGLTWHAALGRAYRRSKAHPVARYAQLATVDADSRPRCRTIVVRRLELESDELLMVTDARSAKVEQAAGTGAAELCWYFAGLREQFRLHGVLEITAAEDDRRRRELWTALSVAGRASFSWPPPGTPRTDDDHFPDTCGDPTPPAAFCAMSLRVDEVDWLRLRAKPHERTLFARSEDGEWRASRVRP